MSRRGIVLYATLVVILSTALAAGTILAFLISVRAGGEVSRDRVAARAGAWSGIQGVMAELHEQRMTLLEGGSPTITDQWTLLDDPDQPGSGLVIRVIPIDGQAVTSECARLDVNSASAEMLARLASIGTDAAAEMVQRRQQALFDDPGTIPGVGPESLRLITVFAVDPQRSSGYASEQGGLGVGVGDARRSLNADWDDGLGAELDRSIGLQSRECIQSLMSAEGRVSGVDGMLRAFRSRQIPPESWGALLDAFTPSEAPFAFGAVDLNRASVDVLACLPGLDSASAERIVFQRDKIDKTEERSVAWPVTEGIVTEESYAQLAPWITTRSLVWRVRVECGRPEQSDSIDPSFSERLRDRIALEAVIDLSDERPRVAWMRDVTHAEHAAALRDELRKEPEPFDQPIPDASDDPPTEVPERPRRPASDDVGDARATQPAEPPSTTDAPVTPVRDRIGRWNPAGTEPAG